MIVLSATTDSLEIVLSGATTTTPVQMLACYRDIDSTTYTAGRKRSTANSTTPVDISGSPASSTQRVLDFLSIYNADTVGVTFTLRLNDNSTMLPLGSWTLGIGERLEYTDGDGFRVFNAQGVQKVVQIAGNAVYTIGSWTNVVLASDVTNDNASANTAADITGLSFGVTAGETYVFRAVINYTSAATTTGSRWMVTGPASPDLLTVHVSATTSAAAMGFTTVSGYDLPASTNASSLTAGNMALMDGVIRPSSSGTVQLRFASEVSNSAIVAKAGSILRYMRVL